MSTSINLATISARLDRAFLEPPVDARPADPEHTPVSDHRPGSALYGSVFDHVALNPQPLPPRDVGAALRPPNQFVFHFGGFGNTIAAVFGSRQGAA